MKRNLLKKFLIVLLCVVFVAAAPFIAVIVLYGPLLIPMEMHERRSRQEYLIRTIYGSAFVGWDEIKMLSGDDVPSNPQRRFSVTLNIRPTNPGDLRYKPANERQYRISAIRYGEDECRILMEYLASACGVESVEDGPSPTSIVTLWAIQKSDADVPRLGWFAKRDAVRINFLDHRSQPSPDARREIYKTIASGCSQHQRVEAGCTLGSFDFEVMKIGTLDGQEEKTTNVTVTLAVHRNSDLEEILRKQSGG